MDDYDDESSALAHQQELENLERENDRQEAK